VGTEVPLFIVGIVIKFTVLLFSILLNKETASVFVVK